MERIEREALADDIADRVRLIAVHQVPKSMLDTLVNGEQSYSIYAVHPHYVLLRMRAASDGLHVEFLHNNRFAARFRFEADPDR